MNWVGGIRNRLKSKKELKQQKEFFERKRFEAKVKRVKPESTEKSNGVSMDLISFNALTKKPKDTWGNEKKENQAKIRKVDLGESRKKPKAIRDLELPMSPCKQNSKLHFMDAKESARLERNRMVSARKIAKSYDLDMEPSSVELSLEYERKRKQRMQMKHNQRQTLANLDNMGNSFEQFITPASRIIKRFDLPAEKQKKKQKEVTYSALEIITKSKFHKECKRQNNGEEKGNENENLYGQMNFKKSPRIEPTEEQLRKVDDSFHKAERSFSPPSSDMFFNLKKKRDLYSKEFRKNVYQSEDFQKTPIKKYSFKHLKPRKLERKKHENIDVSEQKTKNEMQHFQNSLQPIKEIVSPTDILNDTEFNKMKPTILNYSSLLSEQPIGTQRLYTSPDISTIGWNQSCPSGLSSTDLQSTTSITSSAFSEESPFKLWKNENKENIDPFTDVSQQMFEPSPDSESQIYKTKLKDLLKNGPTRVNCEPIPVQTFETDSDCTNRQTSTGISHDLSEQEDGTRTEKIGKESTTTFSSVNTPAVIKKTKMDDAEEVFVELLHLDEEDKHIDDIDFQMAEEKDLQDFERNQWLLDADQEVPGSDKSGFTGAEECDTESHFSLVDTTPECGLLCQILDENGQPQPSNSLQCLMEDLLEKLSSETGNTLQSPCDESLLHSDNKFDNEIGFHHKKHSNEIVISGTNENGPPKQNVKTPKRKEFWTQTSPFLISITSANNSSEYIDSKLAPKLLKSEDTDQMKESSPSEIKISERDDISKTQRKSKEFSVQCSLLPNKGPLDQMQGNKNNVQTQGVQTDAVLPRPTTDSSTSPMGQTKHEVETQTDTKLCPFCAIEMEESSLEFSRSNTKDRKLLQFNDNASIKSKDTCSLKEPVPDYKLPEYASKISLTQNYANIITSEKSIEKNDTVVALKFSSNVHYEAPNNETVIPDENVEESVSILEEGPKVFSSEHRTETMDVNEHMINSLPNSGTSTLSNYNTADSQTSENCT